nr:uroporphyrinogen decarboxylase family protein [Halarchaeum rubridurum]
MRESVGDETSLIGFAGGPFTLASYIIASGSSRHDEIRQFRARHPDAFASLLDVIADAVLASLQYQIDHGADVVQLFDTYAGELAPADYREFLLPLHRWICTGVDAPVILFVRNMAGRLDALADADPDAVSPDWTVDTRSGAERPVVTLRRCSPVRQSRLRLTRRPTAVGATVAFSSTPTRQMGRISTGRCSKMATPVSTTVRSRIGATSPTPSSRPNYSQSASGTSTKQPSPRRREGRAMMFRLRHQMVTMTARTSARKPRPNKPLTRLLVIHTDSMATATAKPANHSPNSVSCRRCLCQDRKLSQIGEHTVKRQRVCLRV